MPKHLRIHTHEQLSERVYLVTEGYAPGDRLSIGVLVGTEKVLVIDSGLGFTKELRSYIEGIVGTDKPILLTCTHGGIDHAGAGILFDPDKRYCNYRDYWMFENLIFNKTKRLNDLDAFSNEAPETVAYCREVMIQDNKCDFNNIEDGDEFDLGGGLIVKCVAMPAHTAGSIAYYVPSEKLCFTGDAISLSTGIAQLDVFYNRPEHREKLPAFMGIKMDDEPMTYWECFAKYAEVVKRLIDMMDDDTKLISGHCYEPMRKKIAWDVYYACLEISRQEIDEDIVSEPKQKYMSNAITGKDMRGHFHDNVNVQYNKNLERKFF